MSYYRTCPYCGLALDPGERCDCAIKQKEAAPSATNTKSGRPAMKPTHINLIISGFKE